MTRSENIIKTHTLNKGSQDVLSRIKGNATTKL